MDWVGFLDALPCGVQGLAGGVIAGCAVWFHNLPGAWWWNSALTGPLITPAWNPVLASPWLISVVIVYVESHLLLIVVAATNFEAMAGLSWGDT
jgi:hypothetical protein